MFGGHSENDIKHFICHVILQNHVIEGSCNFMNGSSSMYVTILPSLLAIGIVVLEIFLVCHVVYNHFHNILKLLDVPTNFPFTTSETMHDYYL